MKKGISAIISTILLITLVITLGLIYITWSGGLVKKSVERSKSKIGTELDCMDVKLRLEKIEGENKIIIKNNGQKKLSGYIARIIKLDGGVEIDKGGGKDLSINAYNAKTYDYEVYKDDIKKIEIIPKINIAEEGQEIVDCVNKMVAYTI